MGKEKTLKNELFYEKKIILSKMILAIFCHFLAILVIFALFGDLLTLVLANLVLIAVLMLQNRKQGKNTGVPFSQVTLPIMKICQIIFGKMNCMSMKVCNSSNLSIIAGTQKFHCLIRNKKRKSLYKTWSLKLKKAKVHRFL